MIQVISAVLHRSYPHSMSERPEPYRLLFPLGAALAAAGVLPWILLQAGWNVSPNPVTTHGRLMFHGFLGSFAAGFLMTAVPRMSGTQPARRWETGPVFLLLLFQAAAAFFGQERLAAAAMALASLQISFFILRRFARRRRTPPSMFLFVPFGLLSALAGTAWMAFGDPAAGGGVAAYAKKLAFEGFMLNLVVGLGSRLVPVLSRVQGALSPHQPGGPGLRSQLPALLLLNLSFPVEVFFSREAGQILRAAALLDALVRGFRVFAPVATPGFLGAVLRASAVFLCAPYALLPLFPSFERHLLHLAYIGGLGLMTLMVAVRVVLSHGGQPMDFELNGRSLGVVGFLLAATASTRALLPLIWPQWTFPIAAAAGIAWFAALLIWWGWVGRRIDRVLQVLS